LVKRIRYERVETPLPANVRVLTFHAAKGLEFEAVILMDLDVDITAGGERSLRVQQDEEGHFFIQGNQEMMTLQGRASLLAALQEEQWAEMLSLLYVGMTRAASYLDLVFFEKPTRKKSMAQWVRASGLRWHEVNGKSLRTLKPITPASERPMPLQRPSSKKYQKFSQRHPSEEQEGDLVSLGQLLQGRAARERGVALHTELAQIEWEDVAAQKLKIAESPLSQKLMMPGSPLSRGHAFQMRFFLERWKQQGVTQLELWRERRFAVVKEKELISGVFDRVVIGKNEAETPIIAEIIDFKTGNPKQHAELERLYQPQLKAYRTALQEMLPMLREITTRLVWTEKN
jgi:ATP-dependent exoDNAse (exonuclease V) beta subunit